MVEYYLKRSISDTLSRVDKPLSGNGLWVHSTDRRTEVSSIIEHYGLDRNTVQDVYDRHELPRQESKDGVSYSFLRVPNAAGDTVPMLAIVTRHNFITISPHMVFSPAETDVYLTTPTSNPAASLVALHARIVTEYEKHIARLSEMIAKSRKHLKKHDVSNKDFIEFVDIEDKLNDYHTSLSGINDVIGRLAENRLGLFKHYDLESIEDLSLHVSQLIVSIDSNIQSVRSIQSAYSTIANNTMNQRMKALTVVTILLAIPNVFYGMYGMNIALPMQHESWAYPAIIGFTALLILLVFILARRFRLF